MPFYDDFGILMHKRISYRLPVWQSL